MCHGQTTMLLWAACKAPTSDSSCGGQGAVHITCRRAGATTCSWCSSGDLLHGRLAAGAAGCVRQGVVAGSAQQGVPRLCLTTRS
jgi:hypothetical protein